MNNPTNIKRRQKRFNVPVIGHFNNRSIRFNSIIEAEEFTGISYTLIFEACVGKIYKARNVYWEYENGAHYIKYKAYYIRAQRKLEELNSGHLKMSEQEAITEKSEDQQS
ncbi:MAG: hypothetical protein JW894_08060 [Bacteroidales bacterium]|nr:hypothetical protein [Bacteroidales bacterium]